MLGAVMATTKQQLAAIGGFEALVNYLSDDYELGNRIVREWLLASNSARSRFRSCIRGRVLRTLFAISCAGILTIRCSRPLGHLGLCFRRVCRGRCSLPRLRRSRHCRRLSVGLLSFAACSGVGSRFPGMRDHSCPEEIVDAAVSRCLCISHLAAEFFPAANSLARAGILCPEQTIGACPISALMSHSHRRDGNRGTRLGRLRQYFNHGSIRNRGLARSKRRLGRNWIHVLGPGRPILPFLKIVQNQFHSRRYAQFIEHPEKVVADRMFAKTQLNGNLTVHEALSHQPHNILFAF